MKVLFFGKLPFFFLQQKKQRLSAQLEKTETKTSDDQTLTFCAALIRLLPLLLLKSHIVQRYTFTQAAAAALPVSAASLSV